MINGITWLFYDKWVNGFNYFNNNFSYQISIESLFKPEMAFRILFDEEAINAYNWINSEKIVWKKNAVLKPAYITGLFNNYEMRVLLFGVDEKNIEQELTNDCNDQQLSCGYLFFKKLCLYHNKYTSISVNKTMKLLLSNENEKAAIDIIDHVTKKTGDTIDKMIEIPDFLNCQLFKYQKQSINWMHELEMEIQKPNGYNKCANYSNNEIVFGNVYFNTLSGLLKKCEKKSMIEFNGGALIDEVGLGKTIQMLTVSIMNTPKILPYVKKGCKRLFSRATLIICPNQLGPQWMKEIETMIKEDKKINAIAIFTKPHFDKYTYQDVLDADFVITTYNFFDNPAYLGTWLSEISGSKKYHHSPQFNSTHVNELFDRQGEELINNPIMLKEKNPALNCIVWNRVIVDEFHEMYTVAKYAHMPNIIQTIQGTIKWAVSGTPFEKNHKCLDKMMEFVSGNKHPLSSWNIIEYMKNNFFRRNTKISVEEENKLPPIKNTIALLQFTQTEQMIYNAYLADANNNMNDVFLRKLCCHPKLADETRKLFEECNSLEEIKELMVEHYHKNMLKSKNDAEKMYRRIRVVNYRYNTNIKNRIKSQFKIYKIDINVIPSEHVENLDDEEDSEDSDEENVKHKEINIPPELMKKLKNFNLSDATIDDFLNSFSVYLDGRIVIKNRRKKEKLGELDTKFKELMKIYDGKKATYEYYKLVCEKIEKSMEKKEKNEESNEDSDEESEGEEETCCICMNPVSLNMSGIGVTFCGHIFCFECIKVASNQKKSCPTCNKSIKDTDIFHIAKKVEKTESIVDGKFSKQKLIDIVGTKLANIICYIQNNNDHMIIFSQWDDMLRRTGDMLNEFGIKNVFCRGNVLQRAAAIRTFNTDPNVRIIMLSSESSASGTNLTKASKVILIDPVSGTFESRKNIEGQAIGRAYRTGQKNQVEVIRFMIENTIEQTIHNNNIALDEVHQKVVYNQLKENDLKLSQEKTKEYEQFFETAEQNINIKFKKVKK
jgi:SNF2 family DNA or RNA helicase